MAGFNYAQNIIGLKKGDIHELEVEVANLSASVLTIGEVIEDIQNELTIENKSITLNSTYFNIEDIENNFICEKYGKLVILTMTNLKLITGVLDTDHPILISGLPAPRNASNYVLFGRGTQSGAQEGFRVRLSTTGEVLYWYNNADLPTTKAINGQIIYLTN